jgi:hypothetical protein
MMLQMPPFPQTKLQIWLTFLSPITSTMVTAVLAFIVSRMGAAQKESNVRQEKHLVEIQTFTNSALGMSLKVAATALRRVSDITRDPKDATVAAQAEAQSASHEAAQKVVDAQNTLTRLNS